MSVIHEDAPALFDNPREVASAARAAIYLQEQGLQVKKAIVSATKSIARLVELRPDLFNANTTLGEIVAMAAGL